MLRIRPEQIDALRIQLQAETPRRIRESLLAQNVPVTEDAVAGDLRVSDGRGFITRLHFDTNGLPDRLSLPSQREQRFEHDAQGRLAAVVYPGGQRVEMHHDSNDNIVRLARPGHFSYRFGYDGADRLTAVVDPYARRVQLEYGAKGSLVCLTDRTGAKTVWERDEQGKLLAVRDPLDNRVVYETDEAGRLGAIQFPDGTREEYGFYEEENIVECVTRDGLSVLTYLDADGLPEEIAWEDGSWLLPVFGKEGRLVSLQNENAGIQFEYDEADNVQEETSETGVVSYARDVDGRLTEIVTPWGDPIRYSYDEDGRVVSVVDWEDRAVTLEYAADGTLAKIHRPNGLTEAHRYARVGRLEQAEVVDTAGRVLSQQVYNYDLCERLTTVADRWGDAPEQHQSRQFEYDPEDRLLREVSAAGAPLAVYTYDAKGNLTTCNRRPILVGKMDEPLQVDGTPIAYDAAGNMTRLPNGAGERLHCRFAANGTLSEVDAQGRTWRYAYDGLSRRVLKTDGVTTWRYGWAGHQLLWEEVQETPDSEPMRRDYLWLPDSVTPLAFRENGQTYWLQCDTRDAVIRVLDGAGEVVWNARYDSFGGVQLRTERVRQPWRLAGQYADDETGLYYNFARYYSPHLKSYLSRDPQWHQYGASNYSYCLNDPWNRADPLGTISHKLAVAANIGVSVAVTAAIESTAVAAGATAGAYIGGVLGALLGGPIGAVLGVLAGEALGGFLGGLAGVGLGALAGSLVQQVAEKKKICIPCALKEAGIAVALTVALLGVGRIPVVRRIAGKGLAFMKSKLLTKTFNPTTQPGPLMLSEEKVISKLAVEGNFVPSELDIYRARLATISTFRSGTYTRTVLQEDTLFYRSYGGNAQKMRAFWSRTPPKGKLQNSMDSAILDEWANTQQKVAVMKVPSGTVIYEGATASQTSVDTTFVNSQVVPGGGNQAIFKGGPKEEWLVQPQEIDSQK